MESNRGGVNLHELLDIRLGFLQKIADSSSDARPMSSDSTSAGSLSDWCTVHGGHHERRHDMQASLHLALLVVSLAFHGKCTRDHA